MKGTLCAKVRPRGRNHSRKGEPLRGGPQKRGPKEKGGHHRGFVTEVKKKKEKGGGDTFCREWVPAIRKTPPII